MNQQKHKMTIKLKQKAILFNADAEAVKWISVIKKQTGVKATTEVLRYALKFTAAANEAKGKAK